MKQDSIASARPGTRQFDRKTGMDQVHISRTAAELSRRSREALQKKEAPSG